MWPFHNHKFIEISREQGYRYTGWGSFVHQSVYPQDEAVTLITWRCVACKKFKQKILKGHLVDTTREKVPQTEV